MLFQLINFLNHKYLDCHQYFFNLSPRVAIFSGNKSLFYSTLSRGSGGTSNSLSVGSRCCAQGGPRPGCRGSDGASGDARGGAACLRARAPFHLRTTRCRPRPSSSASSARDASPHPPPGQVRAITAPGPLSLSDSAPCRCPCRGRSSCRRCRSSPVRGSPRCIGWRGASATGASFASPTCRPWRRRRPRSKTNETPSPMPLPMIDGTAEDLPEYD